MTVAASVARPQFLSTPSARRATCPFLPHVQRRVFLSTPSARRATRQRLRMAAVRGDFYPRPPRGGRPFARLVALQIRHFYPRPPRGGRLWQHYADTDYPPISIHALREEGDAPQISSVGRLSGFLSTPSARRATIIIPILLGVVKHFYPRPPRGGRQDMQDYNKSVKKFLSTPSARRATDE